MTCFDSAVRILYRRAGTIVDPLFSLPVVEDVIGQPDINSPPVFEGLVVVRMVGQLVGMLLKMMAFGVVVFVRHLLSGQPISIGCPS